jgi:hypothetical protein
MLCEGLVIGMYLWRTLKYNSNEEEKRLDWKEYWLLRCVLLENVEVPLRTIS